MKETRDLFIRSGSRDDLIPRRKMVEFARSKNLVSARIQVDGSAEKFLADAIENNNQGEVHLLPRNADIYLPGSSLKGAVRTAFIERAAKSAKYQQPLLGLTREDSRTSSRFEAAVLNYTRVGKEDVEYWDATTQPTANLYRDPFRQLAFTDLIPDRADCSYVARIQLVSLKRAHNASGINIFREVTRSRVNGDELSFKGELRWYHCVGRTRAKSDGLTSLPPSDLDLGPADWLSIVSQHYRRRLEAELNKWRHFVPRAEDILSLVDKAPKSHALVRLGRHSQFECTTIEEPYRNPPNKGYGNTRTMVNGQLPLGWCWVELEDFEK